MMNALYYDKGYLNVQIGTPRVMLTPDREGIEITVVIHEGRFGSFASTSETTTGARSSRWADVGRSGK